MIEDDGAHGLPIPRRAKSPRRRQTVSSGAGAGRGRRAVAAPFVAQIGSIDAGRRETNVELFVAGMFDHFGASALLAAVEQAELSSAAGQPAIAWAEFAAALAKGDDPADESAADSHGPGLLERDA